ncbi:MAG: hypothetical protein Q8S84_03025 [bacterium]|nr:hypothetical protein [bacterium]MDP3380504.1 hypothetical protein [bacterium]
MDNTICLLSNPSPSYFGYSLWKREKYTAKNASLDFCKYVLLLALKYLFFIYCSVIVLHPATTFQYNIFDLIAHNLEKASIQK